jgi:DNA-binding transcriptional regulator GbsR (MarR family)
MATGSVSAAKKELLKLGFIIKAHGQSGRLSHTFRNPSDIWDRNKKHFEAAAKAKRSIRESQHSPIERPRSHGETIKNRKEKPEEKPSTHQADIDSMELRFWKHKFLKDGADHGQFMKLWRRRGGRQRGSGGRSGGGGRSWR